MRTRLPREHHQGRVERDGQQEVAGDDVGEGPDGREVVDAPLGREGVQAAEDEGDHGEAEDEGALEAPQQPRQLLEEVDLLQLLGRRAPRHVHAEEVAQDRLRHVQRDAPQEDRDQRYPLQVVPDCAGRSMESSASLVTYIHITM